MVKNHILKIGILLVFTLFAVTGCTQGLYYAGMTKVEFTKDKDGVKDFMYLNGGRAMKKVDVDYSCPTPDKPDVCTVHVTVEESSGVEAVKEHAKVGEEIGKTLRGYKEGVFIP